jgi:hypothetical protein
MFSVLPADFTAAMPVTMPDVIFLGLVLWFILQMTPVSQSIWYYGKIISEW